MRRTQWVRYVLPGLCELWKHGSWQGLAVALSGAAVLDALLLASFGWSELIESKWRIISWAAFGVGWLAAVGWSIRQGRSVVGLATVGSQDNWFTEAVDYYLQGDYYQAEHGFERLLRRSPQDIEARLMLATLLRRVGRFDRAAAELDRLARLEKAAKWKWEIDQERKLLAKVGARQAGAA